MGNSQIFPNNYNHCNNYDNEDNNKKLKKILKQYDINVIFYSSKQIQNLITFELPNNIINKIQIYDMQSLLYEESKIYKNIMKRYNFNNNIYEIHCFYNILNQNKDPIFLLISEIINDNLFTKRINDFYFFHNKNNYCDCQINQNYYNNCEYCFDKMTTNNFINFLNK